MRVSSDGFVFRTMFPGVDKCVDKRQLGSAWMDIMSSEIRSCCFFCPLLTNKRNKQTNLFHSQNEK